MDEKAGFTVRFALLLAGDYSKSINGSLALTESSG